MTAGNAGRQDGDVAVPVRAVRVLTELLAMGQQPVLGYGGFDWARADTSALIGLIAAVDARFAC